MSMYVINSINGKLIHINDAVNVIMDIRDGVKIYGYVPCIEGFIRKVRFWNDDMNGFDERSTYYKALEGRVIKSTFDNRFYYLEGAPEKMILRHTQRLGTNLYPYDFDRRYEAVDHFNLFNGAQNVLEIKRFKLSSYLKKLTFGLEFETSLGAIPEELCFRDGLIPLRDGSISGVEYSTIVLKRNSGLSLLSQAVKTLKEYTVFNKDCSLHVHVGGFPLDKDVIFRIYQTCYKLQDEISSIIPAYSFYTSKYKSNKKDYCKPLPCYKDFKEMFYCLVGKEFEGRLDKPHPRDIERGHKWNVNTRYYAFNFINAICYNVNKTIEFRFLRPTFNFKKILLWLYIFGAIVKFGKDSTSIDMYSNITLHSVLKKVYPTDLVDSLVNGICKLQIATQMQHDNGDLIGEQTVFEDRLFKGDDDW